MDALEGLIDEKVAKVLKVFLEKDEEFFHINKVADESGVSLATTFRIINRLLDSRFLEQTRISKFKIYRLADNAKTRKLRSIL